MSREPFHWFAEQYEPHGSTAGEGARRLLGTPGHDPLTVLVRETAQNSWDARSPGTGLGEVSYTLNLRELPPEGTRFLREVVFPHDPVPTLPLADSLGGDSVRLLQIEDRGTTGLGGPVRADLEPDDDQRTDFIDFVFNIGARRDTHLGGGTYGFGKTIAYIVSRARTILILSEVEAEGERETRVIGAAITEHFAEGETRYTGRQWWGRLEDGRIGPVTGPRAQAVADQLDIRFDGTGTTIVVVDPELRKLPLRDAGEHLRDAVLWHLWPKSLARPGDALPAMRMTVSVEDEALRLPHPFEVEGLAPFARALQSVRHAQEGTPEPETSLFTPETHEVTWGRARVPTGHLSLVRSPVRPGRLRDRGEDSDDSVHPFHGPAHHVAAMRQAELVVEYLEGPPSKYEGYEWAGVFRCSGDVDDHFADAEPPAHDQWEWRSVEGERGRSYVRTALRKVNAAMREFAAPALERTGDVTRRSAAAVADQLLALAPDLTGTGAAREEGGEYETNRTTKRPTVDIGSVSTDYDGQLLTRIGLTLERARARSVEVSISVGVATDTGTERSPPRGARDPRVREVKPTDGGPPVAVEGGAFTVGPRDPTEWTLTVETPDPSALRIGTRARYTEA